LEDAQAALGILSSQHPQGLRPGEGELCHKRAGLAALQLGNYETAMRSFEEAAQLAKLNQRSSDQYSTWIQQCKDQLNPPTTTSSSSSSASVDPERPIVEDIPTKVAPKTAAPAKTTKPNNLPQMPKYQYYQSDTVMTISILEANVREENLNVTFEPKKLTVRLRKGGVDFTVIAGHLYAEVVVDRCKIVYKDEKVLIKLRKKDAFEWHELFGKPIMDDPKPEASTKDEASSQSTSEATKPVPTVTDKTRVRPYASHRDWDAIEKEILNEEKNEKPVGDEAMNKLFQQIYANASEDTRRAMIKSYQTSGGTVLSTNWDEVSKKNYEQERTAPKGMEWKTWEGDKLPMKDDD
jgi:suppressor of G2 allele of SKP1